MRKIISQREAQTLRKRVAELEGQIARQRRNWNVDYPGGVNLGQLNYSRESWLVGRIEGARMMGHAVIVTESNDGALRFYALPQAGK